jgi:hypothetical protein
MEGHLGHVVARLFQKHLMGNPGRNRQQLQKIKRDKLEKRIKLYQEDHATELKELGNENALDGLNHELVPFDLASGMNHWVCKQHFFQVSFCIAHKQYRTNCMRTGCGICTANMQQGISVQRQIRISL